MHPEIKQLAIDIVVFLSVVFVPILILLGAYLGIQALTSLGSKRMSGPASSSEPQDA